MGLFDFFRKNKNNIQNRNINDVPQTNSNLTLQYRSGTKCEVEFAGLREMQFGNGNMKMVQEVIITYIEPNGSFSQKRVMLDPQVMRDQQGNAFYATKAYYEDLAKQNMSLVKGFFQKDQLDAIENGYIGHIGVDPGTGAYNRSYDKDVKAVYDEKLRNEKLKESLSKEERFEKELQEQTQKIENIKPHYKDSHAQQLTREDYEQYFGGR